MTDTAEENTRWINTWVVNDETYYYDAQEAAAQGPEALRAFVEEALANAPKDTGAWYTGREMTPSDYDSVDWADVADSLQ